MKLFMNLTEADQTLAINFCMQIVISDFLDPEFKLEAEEDNSDLTEMNHINEVIDRAHNIESEEEKVNLLLDDEKCRDTMMHFALEMAKSNYYSEENEVVIDLEELRNEDESCEECEEGCDCDCHNDETDKVEGEVSGDKPANSDKKTPAADKPKPAGKSKKLLN